MLSTQKIGEIKEKFICFRIKREREREKERTFYIAWKFIHKIETASLFKL